MRARVPGQQGGVSLAEVLVAMFIMSAVGVVMIVGMGSMVKINDMTRTTIAAESLARSGLEFVSSQPYPADGLEYILQEDGLTWITKPPDWPDDPVMPEGYPGYSLTVKASDKVPPSITDDGNETTYIKEITAEVKYNGEKVLAIATYWTGTVSP